MLALVLSSLSKSVEASLVSIVISMTEVETRYRHSSLNKSLKLFYLPARRAEGAHNLCVTVINIGRSGDAGKGNVRAAKLGS
jgi:hypothetical protein